MTARAGGWLALLLLVFTLAWFGTLEHRKLIKPDEGRYAEIAREMALSGDFVTPRLNGIKYFEKPPLQYWATAAAFKAFGPDEWTARLWGAVTGFAGVLLALFAGRRLFGRTAGNLAAVVLGTSLGYFLIGHLNTLDMGLCFFLEAAVLGFALAQRSPEGSKDERRWMLAAWAAMALAILSKGLIGIVLPGAALVVYCLVQRTVAPVRRMHFLPGLALFGVIVAPWFIAVSLANPEFPRFFFIHEHFERYLTQEHRRYQPAWYFVPILAAALLPWTTPALQAGVAAWRAPATGFHAQRFLVVWAVVVFAFFSASGSKLPSYILPILPALALVTGDWLSRATPRALAWHVVPVAVLVAAACGLFVVRSNAESDSMTRDYGFALAGACALVAIGALITLRLLRRRATLRAIAVFAAASLAGAMVALEGHEALGRSNSAHYIAGRIAPLLSPGVPFYSVGMYDQTLPFYLNRTVTLVDYADEFSFGLQQEPQRALPTVQAFREQWLRDADAFAIFTPDGWRAIQPARLPMQVIAKDDRRVIVRKAAR